jgi:hypothetical protein
MSLLNLRTPLAALLAVVLLLAMASCNSHDDPLDADVVPVVEGIAYTGTVASDATSAVVANVTVRIEGRAPSVTGFFNEATFTTYTVDYFGAGGLPILNGVINTAFIPIDQKGDLFLTVLPGSLKGAVGAVAGLTLPAKLRVSGHDLLGNPVSFEADLAVIFT